jgi:hypothetical protein
MLVSQAIARYAPWVNFRASFVRNFATNSKLQRRVRRKALWKKIKLAVALIEPAARMTSQLSPACHP